VPHDENVIDQQNTDRQLGNRLQTGRQLAGKRRVCYKRRVKQNFAYLLLSIRRSNTSIWPIVVIAPVGYASRSFAQCHAPETNCPARASPLVDGLRRRLQHAFRVDPPPRAPDGIRYGDIVCVVIARRNYGNCEAVVDMPMTL
jgi:hypothetical protein